ncbi:MAG TPA: hypothetical protein VF411_07015 [Bacteroidia bacterium]
MSLYLYITTIPLYIAAMYVHLVAMCLYTATIPLHIAAMYVHLVAMCLYLAAKSPLLQAFGLAQTSVSG